MFDGDVIRFDPFTTALTDAIDLILGLEFQKFPVPCPFELLAEQFVHVLQVNMIACAAAGWHVGRVGER